MIYRKASEQGPRSVEPLRSGGRFTRYLDIGDDRYALRHIDVYENGHVLRYDRSHWVDKFGTLAAMRYDKKQWEKWWGPAIPIESAEFEAVWYVAEASPLWHLQLRSSLWARLGQVPIWLRH